MTVCNMAIEAGARVGMVAVDETTLAYVKGRTYAPKGELWDRAAAYWRTLHSDANAHFDRVIDVHGSLIKPQVSWGTSPEMVVAIDAAVPNPQDFADPTQRRAAERALEYMGLKAGQPMTSIQLD